MKRQLLFIGLFLFVTCSVVGQRGVRIGYVDMEYILENVEEYRDAQDQLAKKVLKWKLEIEEMEQDVNQLKKDLAAEKVLLTDELVAEREEEIEIMEREMRQYQQDRFGPEGDLVLQKRLLIQPIQDQVFNEVQQIGATKKYDFIFDKSADVVMLYSEKRHDISDLVLRGIARTRKVSKPKEKKVDRERIEALQAENQEEEEVSEAIQERIDRAEEAQDARQKAAEDRRAEQLRLREERKKAYEERRRKLLEEREARRKAREAQTTEQPADTTDVKDPDN